VKNLINSVVNTKYYNIAKTKNEKIINFWGGTSLYYVHALSSKSKGSILENIVIELCENYFNLVVEKRKNSSHDVIIDGYETEIKSSMTWDNRPNNWVWQQIRRKQKYDRIIFMGCNPEEVYLWWADKNDLNNKVFPVELKLGQHGGGEANDTFWVSADGIHNIPEWFKTMEYW